MRSRLRLTLSLPLAALLACGGSTNSPSSAGNPLVTGDYVFTISPSGSAAINFTGALAVTGTSVTGVLRYSNPNAACVSATQDIGFIGSVANGALTLTSAAFSSSTATLTVQLPLSGSSGLAETAGGTAVIAGGSCALASTSLLAAYIPSYGQSYSGSLTGPVDGTLALAIAESAADADGQFPVVATITYTGTSCSFSLTPVTGLVSGYTLSLGNGTTAPNSEIAITASSTTSPINVNMSVFAGISCPIGSYAGTIH